MIVGLVLGWALGDSGVAEARIGERAPDFTVDVIDGDSFNLAEHLESDGRPLVLNLWASWCFPCRTEIPEISAFATNHPDYKVLGVAVEDTERAATDFAREIEAAYDLAYGNREFELAYPRIGLPVTYIIDSSGEVIDLFNGGLNEATLVDLVGG